MSEFWNNLAAHQWQFKDIIDVLGVALLLYLLLTRIRGARAVQIFLGLALLLWIITPLSGLLHLNTLHHTLLTFRSWIPLVVVVLFQNAIRRFLAGLGRLFWWTFRIPSEHMKALQGCAQAIFTLAAERTGALLVFERNEGVEQWTERGVTLDAQVSKELICSLFQKLSPLHDGALLLKKDRILSAGVYLPLSDEGLPESMGTRHRAALGASQHSDALVLVASEETGKVHLAVEGQLQELSSPEETLSRLTSLFLDSKTETVHPSESQEDQAP